MQSLKVNVNFVGKFGAVIEDVEIEANTFFNTKNKKIFESTDFDEWFAFNKRGGILVDIEDL